MIKRFSTGIFLVMLCLPLLGGCSGNNGKKEKSTAKQQTNTVAHEAVKMIKTPVNRAKSAAKAQEQYSKKVKEQATN